jgi:hypothetical protein
MLIDEELRDIQTFERPSLLAREEAASAAETLRSAWQRPARCPSALAPVGASRCCVYDGWAMIMMGMAHQRESATKQRNRENAWATDVE